AGCVSIGWIQPINNERLQRSALSRQNNRGTLRLNCPCDKRFSPPFSEGLTPCRSKEQNLWQEGLPRPGRATNREPRPMSAKAYLSTSPEVRQALHEGKPVVALESTIITHGMPYPQNGEMARNVEGV